MVGLVLRGGGDIRLVVERAPAPHCKGSRLTAGSQQPEGQPAQCRSHAGRMKPAHNGGPISGGGRSVGRGLIRGEGGGL